MDGQVLPNVGREFADAELGNIARNRRISLMADLMEAQPEESLPKQMLNSAGLEGAYRLMEKPNFPPQAVLNAHIDKTFDRMSSQAEVLVLHDTTEFRFSGEVPREGLGYLNGQKQQGFYAHFSIAVVPDTGEPLGTVHAYAWNRPNKPTAVPEGKSRRRTNQYDPNRESLRWGESVLACAEQSNKETELIHVMDREGDCLELFALLQEYEQRFVTRLAHNRRLSSGRSTETTKLFERLSVAPIVLEREVVLSQRGEGRSAKERKKHPKRKRRNATLAIRAETLEIFAANGVSANVPDSMTLNFVDVVELNPPDGCQPVHWRLVTTEPIDTPEQIAAVVDSYRMRWLIEEFFKAIKTGCRYQERQLRTAEALCIDLALECAIAWKLLLMRWLSRAQPEAPAARALTPSELGALTELCAANGHPLPPNPTVKDALYAVAQLGGHIKYHGPPGWLVLRRGIADLAIAERLWLRMNRIRN